MIWRGEEVGLNCCNFCRKLKAFKSTLQFCYIKIKIFRQLHSYARPHQFLQILNMGVLILWRIVGKTMLSSLCVLWSRDKWVSVIKTNILSWYVETSRCPPEPSVTSKKLWTHVLMGLMEWLGLQWQQKPILTDISRSLLPWWHLPLLI